MVKHLQPDNYIPRLLDHPELIRHATLCHFRAFNGQHCQVPVVHRRQLTPEAKSYLIFAHALMQLWKSDRGPAERILLGCPEMGPCREKGAGYNITGFPPAWASAIALRDELTVAWQRRRPDPRWR